jgi:hypothetical protein
MASILFGCWLEGAMSKTFLFLPAVNGIGSKPFIIMLRNLLQIQLQKQNRRELEGYFRIVSGSSGLGL